MGNVINTSTGDYSPFLAADSKTLYFSSDGHGGFGNNDILYRGVWIALGLTGPSLKTWEVWLTRTISTQTLGFPLREITAI
ncbi:MAG: PD40 domain-containing protein [Flavobacteriales bacterium]|nr:PD40 domain-containing protein [Flavobacteriales bacterium]